MNQEVPDSGVTFYLSHTAEELYQKAAGLEVLPRSISPEGISIREEKYFTCSSCFRHFQTKDKWRKHRQECETEHEHNAVIKKEGETSRKDVTFWTDDEKSSEIDVLSEVCPEIVGEDGKLRYSCFDTSCYKEFDSPHELKEHLKIHVKEEIRFFCESCSMAFETEEELAVHEESHEVNPAKPYMCPNCGKRFRFKVSLTRHVKSVHRNEKRFACTWCDKPFFEKSNLVKHMRVHTDDRPYGCEVCEKRFRQANSLRVHMKIHTNEDRFQCQICDRSFPTEAGLEKHHLRHKVREGIKCEVCHLSFPTRSTLSKHMLTHTGERAFACSVCEKRFYHKGHLTEHFRTHTGEKPFECKLCGRRFTQRTALTQHNSRFHMDGKPFVCVCGEGFPRKCDLKIHKAECSYCE